MMGVTLEECHHANHNSGGYGISRGFGADKDGQATIEVDGVLGGSWEESIVDMGLLWDQPADLVRVDGGSEFQRRGLRLFVLSPRSPKLNGWVERAQRTHAEEFYEVTDFSLDVATLNQELQVWERSYNTIRPHQALGYLTPNQYVTQWQLQRKKIKCH